MNVITGKFDFAFFVNLNLKGKKAVIDWCINMGLISNKYECPTCKSPMKLCEKADNIDGYVWVCKKEDENEHYIERSVRKGSFLERSDLGIITIMFMTYLWVKKASCEFIEDELDLPKETIEEWLTFYREVCVEIILSKNTQLGGENVIVQIEECKFQKKKLKKNDYVAGGWVYVGFEKETDKGFLEVVKRKSQKTLLKVIKKYILPGTILISDCWKLYDCAEEEEFLELKESLNLKYEDIGVGLGTAVIGLRRSVKRTLNDDPRISCNFDIYLAEYMWRRLNSDIPYELMRSFFEEIIILFPPESKDPEKLTNFSFSPLEENITIKEEQVEFEEEEIED